MKDAQNRQLVNENNKLRVFISIHIEEESPLMAEMKMKKLEEQLKDLRQSSEQRKEMDKSMLIATMRQ